VSIKKKLRPFIKNESGMAIIMVTTAVAILTLILTEFTFETKLNMIRTENQVDRYQAKLNAEAGLKLSIGNFKIYKQAWNTLEDNESLKSTISPKDIEQLVTVGFRYPFVFRSEPNIIQKNAVEEFEKDNLLRGALEVDIFPVTGFLNPNNLKVIKESGSDPDSQPDEDDDEETQQLKPYQFMEKTFIETIEEIVKDKIEKDEEFAIKYSNLNIELLVKELKYYVSNPQDYDEPEKADLEKLYTEEEISPKHAAFESIDELYTLAGWDDDLVNLIKDRISVHQVSVININKLTQNQLKTLFPSLTEFQMESFFKRRDGDAEAASEEGDESSEAKPFKDEPEFKKYLTEELGAIEASDYDKRIAEFNKADITLGVAAKLYRVRSKGTFGRSSYQLTAFIDLPVKPEIKKSGAKDDPTKDDKLTDPTEPKDDKDSDPSQDDDSKKDEEKKKTYLLPPRIVEIRKY